MPRSFYANIYYLYLIKLSKWLMLIMPIVALFYNDNGLDSFDIFLLQAVYSFSVAVLEIPSGYMADIIGRKKSLVIGSILGTLGFVIYSYSYTFNAFLLAEIVLGIGGSFISGSDSALLFDSLAARNNEHYYLRYEGRITALGNLAETIAAIGGGLLAAWFSYRAVYEGQAIIAAIAIPASCLLIEPERETLPSSPSLGQILRISFQALFINKKLSTTIFMSSATGTATLCMAWTAQVYFVTVGFTELQITPLWVLLNLTVALVSASAASVVSRIGNQRALILIAVFIPLGYVLLGALPVLPAILTLFLFYMVRGYATPMLKDLINQNCESQTRATVLSIRSLIVRMSFTIIGPGIGYIATKTTLSIALIAFGVLLGIANVAACVSLLKEHPLTNTND